MKHTILVLVTLFFGLTIVAQELVTLHTLNAKGYGGIPINATGLQMLNGQQLFIAYTQNPMEIPVEKTKELGIPMDAVVSLMDYDKCVYTYYFAQANEKECTIYTLDNLGKKRKLHQFIYLEDQWMFNSNEEDLKDWLAYRDRHWKPEKGQYYFGEQYVYDYTKGENQGIFSFYFDPVSGTILLRKGDSFNDEMLDYVLVRPKQDYIIGYTDEFGEQKNEVIPQDEFYVKSPKLHKEELEDFFSSHLTLQSLKTTTITENKEMCIQEVRAYEYTAKFKTDDTSVLSLAFSLYDFTNLYLLAKTQAMPESGLLIPLFGMQLPNYLLPLGEISVVAGKSITSKLQCIMATDYHLLLRD